MRVVLEESWGQERAGPVQQIRSPSNEKKQKADRTGQNGTLAGEKCQKHVAFYVKAMSDHRTLPPKGPEKSGQNRTKLARDRTFSAEEGKGPRDKRHTDQ